MKKLLIKGSMFSIIILLSVASILFLSTKEPTRARIAEWTNSEEFMDENEMLPYFDKAREQDGTTQLIIGDSVCRQMFADLEKDNPGTSILATNAALMITGQYLLAEEYLQEHPDTTDVFLVMHPLTLTRTFDTEWSYRYAVMTYVETGSLQHLDANTLETMKTVYGSLFLQKNVVQLIEASPVCRKLSLSYLNFNAEEYIQKSSFEIADQYVKKLYDLCREQGVKLHLYASPVAEYYKEQIGELAVEYEQTWMYSQYPDYMNDIWYYPSEWAEDLSHFSGEYAERGRLNEVIGQAYADTELLKKINMTDSIAR